MGDTSEFIERLKVFASQLSPELCREQLVLAYLQMERCRQVLHGEDVEPVVMMDNGESSDLELFYLCKKVRIEMDSLYKDNVNGKQSVIGFFLGVS